MAALSLTKLEQRLVNTLLENVSSNLDNSLELRTLSNQIRKKVRLSVEREKTYIARASRLAQQLSSRKRKKKEDTENTVVDSLELLSSQPYTSKYDSMFSDIRKLQDGE